MAKPRTRPPTLSQVMGSPQALEPSINPVAGDVPAGGIVGGIVDLVGDIVGGLPDLDEMKAIGRRFESGEATVEDHKTVLALSSIGVSGGTAGLIPKGAVGSGRGQLAVTGWVPGPRRAMRAAKVVDQAEKRKKNPLWNEVFSQRGRTVSAETPIIQNIQKNLTAIDDRLSAKLTDPSFGSPANTMLVSRLDQVSIIHAMRGILSRSLGAAKSMGVYDDFIKAVDSVDPSIPGSVADALPKLRIGLDKLSTLDLMRIAGALTANVRFKQFGFASTYGQGAAIRAAGGRGVLTDAKGNTWRVPEAAAIVLQQGLPEKMLRQVLTHEMGHTIAGFRSMDATASHFKQFVPESTWNSVISPELMAGSVAYRPEVWNHGVRAPAGKNRTEFLKYLQSEPELIADALGFIISNPEVAKTVMPAMTNLIQGLARTGQLSSKRVFSQMGKSAYVVTPLITAAAALDEIGA